MVCVLVQIHFGVTGTLHI